MTLTRRLLAALLPVVLSVAPSAHADPAGAVDTGLVLQGSMAYACYGCGPDATFTGIATWTTDDGRAVTVPASGTFSVDESCGATGGAYGVLHLGDEDFSTWLNRYGDAVVIEAFGPAGGYRPDLGPGTLTLDGPSGTCGVPATASLTAVLAPFFNCYCYIGG